MKINDKSERQYKLENLKIGECFRDEHGEIYIKTDDYECVNENERMILCVNLECGEIIRFYNEEEVEYLPNACLNIEG